ncbi:MAG: UDP-N-acetylmuramoyl-tripeptide--D-alanyl-D-alanine ligase [Actinomycetota bacterium]
MKARPLTSVARAVGGRLLGDDVWVNGVATDSRAVGPGHLFVALHGERMNGHRFVGEAFVRGAAAAMVSDSSSGDRPVVVVEETDSALRELASDERASMAAEVVGVTGSTGKTSVKDLTAAVLGGRYRVSASPRSFNTEVGVPLTMLNASADAEVVVAELGSRGPGHIAALCRVARPSIGVVTNVGMAHMAMFGSAEAVADAKAELVEALPESGTAVLNADDPVVRTFVSRTRARPLLFGTAEDAEVRAEDLSLDRLARPSFTLRAPGGTERVELSVSGEHMAWNALAAAACGIALGLSPGECAAALKDAEVSSWRMEVAESGTGLRVINDAYNANPASMTAALKALAWMAARGESPKSDAGRAIAVLGEMAELGPIADREHERVGELVARLGIDHVVVVGRGARLIGAGALREGVEADRITTCRGVEEAVAAVRALGRPGDVVLVKGSRVAGLERLAAALQDDRGRTAGAR